YKMPAVEDLCSEPNFTARWMSDTSRAGVLLDPNFPGLKINKKDILSGHENITADVDEVLHFSSSYSISEDSLCEEQILESSSSCRAQQHSNETTFPTAAAFTSEASKRALVHGEEDGQNMLHYNHPLLQKLEQLANVPVNLYFFLLEKLKELQQKKQEQLKKQQMEQLQRLMEEKQKLLSMVSAQTAVCDLCFFLLQGSALVAEGQNLRSEHSLGLTALQFPSSLYQNHSEVRAFAVSNVSSQTQDSRFLQNNKERISSSASSLPAVSACEKQCLGAPLKMQNCLESNEEDKYNMEQKMEESVESKECHMDHVCVENADFSENSSGENHLRVTNTEERPIKAGIQEKKRTFEEFLEEQIQLEEQRLKQNHELQERSRSTIQKPVIKRPFLKRGEGLTRFTSAKLKVKKLRENNPKPQQSVAEDRSQIQKKTLPLSKEPVSQSSFAPCKKYNQSGKVKQGLIQKTLVPRNRSGKNSFPLETRVQTGKNLDGQTRDSFLSEVNNKIENKENIMEFGKSINMGNRIRNKFPEMEKPQLCCELTSASSNPKGSVSHSLRGPEQSFEVSFQNKLENWEKEKEKENLELDEFLFLEQAADEISFSSNSSFVQRILDQDQQTLKGRRMSSTPIKAKQQQGNALSVTLKNKKNKKANSDTQGNKNDRAVLHTASTSGTALRLKDQFNKTDSVMFSASSMTVAPALKNTPWIVTEDKDEGTSDITTDSETESETTLKCESEDANTSFLSHRESDPELFGYGSTVTNINRERKSGDADLDLPDKDCSALSKQSRASDCQRSTSRLNRSRFEFDDERTWSDLDENLVQNDLPEKCALKMPIQAEFSCKNDTFVPDKTIKRKVASKRGDELSEEPAADDDSNGPPASNLMMKLFPSLKPKQKPGCPSEHEVKPNGEQEPGGITVPSQLLKEKLTELETEIERFRAENTTLTKLREEREHALASLRKEIADFQEQKIQELAEIEEYKKKEMKKLQKERKVFEKYTTEVRAIPDKKERDEIQALKQQIAELQEEIKQKETKWLTTQRRLRDQIEVLVNENLELKEEVKIMERFRVEAWKKAEAAENKRKIE
ncbi:Centromere protein J, partial [Tinamus guttatus]